MDKFRNGVMELASKGVDIMDSYFDGEVTDSQKIKMASKVITEGVKVSNRDQVDAQVRRSQAIRLVSFIPKENRAEYIALTNPEAKPFLLDRPKK